MSKAPRQPLPLDSPHWLPLPDVHRSLCAVTGDRRLAGRDLTGAQADGRAGSMRRRLSRGIGPDRELVQPSFWAEHEIRIGQETILIVESKGTPYFGARIHMPFRGFAFYVWGPDVRRIWPTAFAQPLSNTDDKPPKRPRGAVLVHDWISICGEIARRCIDRTGRVAVPKSERKLAVQMLGWCRNKNNHEPAESAMREAVKRVCAALRPAQK